MYRVIILEDDPMVASINRQFLSANPRFSLEGCFSNGSEALAYLRVHENRLHKDVPKLVLH